MFENLFKIQFSFSEKELTGLGKKLPRGDPGPEPVRLDDLLDDEGVEDDDGEVGQQVGQDQLAPDDVDGRVQLQS